MIEEFKELNIADVFVLRYHRTKDGKYQQTYTPEEFDQMQEWLDRALGEYTQSMEVENNMLRARNDRLEALTQPEQEPVVGTKSWLEDGKVVTQHLTAKDIYKEPEQEEYLSKAYRLANELRCHLAIAPAPQRTWVGLTDEERNSLYEAHHDKYNLPNQGSPDGMDYERAIEAKLKEKNT